MTETGQAAPASSPRLWPLYAGGFLGPFGGAMVSPMLPELSQGLHTSVATAATSLTAYLLPFALLMLFSGTLAESWGRQRTIQIAYLVYVVASIACAFSPTIHLFLVARAIQGMANAFTTPILLAVIADLVPASRLGAALGRYGSLQAAGFAFAPLVGGSLAEIDWRLAFGAIALTGLALALMPPPSTGAAAGREGGSWGALLNGRLLTTCLMAAAGYFTSLSIGLLCALLAAERFGLSPSDRGLMIAVYGVGGLVGGGAVGRLFDRLGVVRFTMLSSAALAATAVAAGFSRNLVVLGLALMVGGLAGTAARLSVSALALRSTPGNRAGASSMALAWQFTGGSIAPLILVPVFYRNDTLALVASAIPSLLMLVTLPMIPRRLLSS